MATYSTNLALTLMATGEQSNTWGDTTNTNLGTLLEQAISGYVTQAITDGSSANTTITIPDGATGVARNMFIEMTGALTFSTTSLIVPANKKMYFVFNNTTGGYAVTVKVTGQTGILVPNGKKVILTCNGTDIVEAHTAIVGNATMGGTLGVTGASTIAALSATTGTFSSTLGVTGVATLGNGAILGTPASGTVTNLTGTASININGTVGATTATTGAFTSGTFSTTLGVTGTSTLAAVNASGKITSTVGNNGIVLENLSATTGYQYLRLVSTGASGLIGIDSSVGGVLGTGTTAYSMVLSTQNATSLHLVSNSVVGLTLASGGAVTIPGTLGVTGLITASANGKFLLANGATTGQLIADLENSGGRLVFGVANSAGTAPISSSTAYAVILNSDSGTPIELAVSSTTRLKITSTGAAVTGTLGVTGATTLQGITVGLGAGAISTNTAVGYQALFGNTSGAYNTAIGNQALYSNTTNSFNVAIGDRTLYSNTTGTQNTAIGIQALYSNLTGSYNVADGVQALYNNTGSYNTGCGYSALSSNTSGGGNTAISPYNSSGSYAPVFDPTTQSNRFCMGSTGITNAYIQVAWTVVSDERDKTDFAPVPHGIDFVSKLKPTAYRYKMNREDTEGHGPIRYGFKAQDVLALEGIDPVIVDAENAEKLRFNDQSMIAVLVNAIQELSAKVAVLEAK